MRASHDHDHVTLPRRAIGHVLEILTIGDRALQGRSAMSLIVEKRSRCFRRMVFRPSREAPSSISFSITLQAASIAITAIPKGIGQGAGRRVGNAGARQCARGGATAFRPRYRYPRDEPRSASSGDVRQRHRVCRHRGSDRSSGVDFGVGGLLQGISLAGRTQNGRNARKKRASLDCAARFR
jgi:hypothetical protein